ncbi:MAG: lytic transglycosylase domain-containing protein [Alphaproteobacteria bacterium]|nr:lytic transglycosylase domain-containing protein [Alphaproteobacteria bacterium]MDP6516284.1 lytic transglycosylase domain-containing protein [Alphaproteobacteria bacterium]
MREGIGIWLSRGFAIAAAVVLGAMVTVHAEPPTPMPILSESDAGHARAALRAARSYRWQSALKSADNAREALPGVVVRWLYCARQGSGASFGDIAAFIAAHPDWPDRAGLEQHAEKAMPVAMTNQQVIAWFAAHPPRTGLAAQRFAEALIDDGDQERGRRLLRAAWVGHDFRSRDEKAFLAGHGAVLGPADHAARLDRLLWDGKGRAVRRMLHRVDPDQKLLGIARLYLIERHGEVDQAIARLPDDLKQDPGLIYERVRWRRKLGFDDRARALLFDLPVPLGHADRWWFELRLQIRKALDDGYISEAYRLAASSGQTGGLGLAEAEWLAGWIAYRFLAEPAAAFGHFKIMYEGVRSPISLSRAAYWAGRTLADRGDDDGARHWYGLAAAHPTRYYGQLAAQALGLTRLELPGDPKPDGVALAAFEARPLVRAARMLGELGEKKLLRRFVLHLSDGAKTPAEHVLAARLGADYARPEVGIAAAKRSARAGVKLMEAAYPVAFGLGQIDGLETAPELGLLLAVSRQESEMDPTAISSAGARGLMQLIPATAKQMARVLRLKYSRRRLTNDPAFNLRLGGAYLGGLLNRYDGAYALALAAYNAGPSRVKRWLRAYGDPRDEEVDPVDWIETLPFHETRNYIQRVLESTQTYRHRLSGSGDRPQIQLLENIIGASLRLARR